MPDPHQAERGRGKLTGRLIGLIVAGAAIGYGLLPFFAGGFVLVIAGTLLAMVCRIGVRWRDVAWTLSLGCAAALIGALVFFRATP